MVSELSTLIHNLVLDNPVPAKDLAKAIGKPYSTLLREVNPYDAGAKLGAETLLQIMSQTGDVKPLEFMANKLGYSLSSTKGDVPVVTPGAFHAAQDGRNDGVDLTCPSCGSKLHYDVNAAPEAAEVTKRA